MSSHDIIYFMGIIEIPKHSMLFDDKKKKTDCIHINLSLNILQQILSKKNYWGKITPIEKKTFTDSRA